MRRAPELLAFALLLSATGLPGRARGNGAFPDSQSVLTPADRPQELILPTNFGLVISEDGGQSWSWACEQDANALAMLYQLGPQPRHRLFAVANQQVVYSDDGSCSWQIAGGMVAGQSITDFFPDPTNANRVLAVGIASTVYKVFESTTDGGATFERMLYQATGGDAINGVEIARARPATIYLSLTSPNSNPKLARSIDGGATWTVTDLTASLGNGILRIIAVDPDNPDVVLLRLLASTNQALAVTRDGGMTATAPLTIMGFTSFVRLPDGTLLLGALVDSGSVPALFRSADGGATFTQIASPSIKGLSQRGGIAYAATDNFGVGYALGSSSDQGTTWQPVMSYDKIQAIVACLRSNAQCQASCEALAGMGAMSPGMIWEETVCTANPPATTGAGGNGGAGAGGSSGGGGAGRAGAAAGGSGGGAGGGHPPKPAGGGCAVAADEPCPVSGVYLGLAIVATFSVRRRSWCGRAHS